MRSFRRTFSWSFLVVLLIVLASVPASAAVVFSNLSGSNSGAFNLDGIVVTDRAVAFTVPAGGAYRLNTATLTLARAISFLGASVTVSVYTDNSGVPGSSIASLGTASIPCGAPVICTYSNYVFTSASGVRLSGGKTYWLVATGNNTNMRRTTGAFSGVFTLAGQKSNSVFGWQTPILGGSFKVALDADAPVAVTSIARAGSSPTNAASVSWNVTLGGNVTGLTSSNFALAATGISGASITGVSGSGANWTVTASTGTGDGTLGLNLVNDTNLLPGLSTALPFTGEVYTLDRTGTGVVITSTATNPTNITPIPVTVTFSEDVTGFDALDVVVGNGSVSNFAGGPAVYTFDVTPAAPGMVTVDVPANSAQDGVGNGNSAAAQFSISFNSIGLSIIRIALMNDGTDAVTTIPNPVPASTPAFTITSGGGSAVTVNPVTGAFIYAFEPGAPLGVYTVTVQVVSGGQTFDQLVEITMLPAPPPVPLCEAHNFDEGGVVRSGGMSDAVKPFVNCRVLYQNGVSTSWLGSPMYSEANLGVPGLLDLGVQQAVDIFSPGGLTYFEGGAVFCLRGSGTLIWLAASGIPRHPEIVGTYSVPEFPGYTCVTLFEPGTMVLVSDNPMD